MPMDLADVALFCSIVTTGSLSAAGRLSGQSPMAVSRRLAAMEAELGVRLLHRTTPPLAADLFIEPTASQSASR